MDLMDKQFLLVHEGHFSYEAVDTMPVYELNWFFEKLIRYVKEKNAPLE